MVTTAAMRASGDSESAKDRSAIDADGEGLGSVGEGSIVPPRRSRRARKPHRGVANPPNGPDLPFSTGFEEKTGGLSEMGPEGTDSQDQSTDSDESILERVERDHRQIVNFYLKELATAQEPSRIRELLDPPLSCSRNTSPMRRVRKGSTKACEPSGQPWTPNSSPCEEST